MRSILTLTLAGLIAATTLATASAQTTQTTHARRAPVQTEDTYGQDSYGQAWQRSQVAARPGNAYQQPGACVTDDGYGRTLPCDFGGGN